MRRPAALALLAALAGGAALPHPARAAGPLVMELFTSQGCSSCPPADRLLAEIARTHRDVLPLDLHVTYWNRLGWTDPYSLPQATALQQDYDRALGTETYTPQLVVGGTRQMVGSDADAVRAAIADAPASSGPALSLGWSGPSLSVSVGAGTGQGVLLLVGFDPSHSTKVDAGENDGRTLAEVNVVRSLAVLGRWDGTALTLAAKPPAGMRAAVLLTGPDGAVLSAAVLPG